MFKKLVSIILMLLVLASTATAENWYEDEDPAVFVTNPNGAIVWSAPEIGSHEFEVLPYRACIFNFYEYSDDFVGYLYDGDSGYISWNDLSMYPDGENEYPPLYVTNCNEWISVWEEPAVGSGRLAKLPLGTEIQAWAPYDKDFIWYEQGDVYGFVSWEYLTYNLY